MTRYNVKWAGSGDLGAMESDWESAPDTIVEADTPALAIAAALAEWLRDISHETPADNGDLLFVQEVPEPPPGEFFQVADDRLDDDAFAEYTDDAWRKVLATGAVSVDSVSADDLEKWGARGRAFGERAREWRAEHGL